MSTALHDRRGPAAATATRAAVPARDADSIAPASAVDAAALAAEAHAALLRQPQAALSPKFLYDELGSRLFDAITLLPEYGLTRAENALAERHRDAIADYLAAGTGPSPAFVDLGAGDGVKARRWLPAVAASAYLAVDICAEVIDRSTRELAHEQPWLRVEALALDLTRALPDVRGRLDGPGIVFWPGSSVGNFDPDEARRLLHEAAAVSHDGALLVGFDLWRDRQALRAAYDDALGVTAAFNRNVLRRLGTLIGADFDLAQWDHAVDVDPVDDGGRVRMFLQCRTAQTVRWDGGERRFAAGERIHTEDSWKWSRDGVQRLLQSAGWRAVRLWCDDAAGFALAAAHADV